MSLKAVCLGSTAKRVVGISELIPGAKLSRQITSQAMPSNEDDIRERKRNLRSLIDNRLKEMTMSEKIKQTYIVSKTIVSNEDFQRAKRIAIYVSMANEIGTFDILKEALNGGKTVFIPMIGGGDMKMVRIKSFDELSLMPKTKWGIIQPSKSDNRENCLDTGGVDFVVAPGMAFTATGLRLGHGKGYYDKFLALNDKVTNSKCVVVAVSFDEQMVEDVPVTHTDFKLSRVVYPAVCNIELPAELPPVPQPFSI